VENTENILQRKTRMSCLHLLLANKEKRQTQQQLWTSIRVFLTEQFLKKYYSPNQANKKNLTYFSIFLKKLFNK